MPTGIVTDVSATLAGGVIGCLLGSRLSDRWKSMLNNILGIAAIVMGIVLILRVHTLSAAILALMLGAVVGEALQLENWVNRGATAAVSQFMRGTNADEAFLMQVSAALVLFCCGGTGWYGALNEGLTGDGSILRQHRTIPRARLGGKFSVTLRCKNLKYTKYSRVFAP